MRILLGIESYLPNISGVTIFTKRLATHLAEKGHRVWVVTTSPFGWAYEEKDPAEFTIFRLRGWRNPFRRDLRVSSFRNSSEVKRLLDDLRPELIHLQDPAVLSHLVLREAKARGIPVIVHNHFSREFVLSYFKRVRFLHLFIWAVVEHIVHQFYNQCALVITPTEFVKRTVESWGVKTPVIAISNGIELERFLPGKPDRAFLSRFGITLKDKIALYLGRLDKDKNVQTLAKAIPILLEGSKGRIPASEVKFLFVGEGTERKHLEEKIRQEPWKDRVHFFGFIPHEDPSIPKIYQASDLYWTASTIETQSLTTLEAMATGLPIVAANFGALPEIVHENENGFLVAPYDAKGFAEAALEIFTDSGLTKRFSRRSVAIARAHDLKKSFKKLEEVYKDVQGRRKNSRAKNTVRR